MRRKMYAEAESRTLWGDITDLSKLCRVKYGKNFENSIVPRRRNQSKEISRFSYMVERISSIYQFSNVKLRRIDSFVEKAWIELSMQPFLNHEVHSLINFPSPTRYCIVLTRFAYAFFYS